MKILHLDTEKGFRGGEQQVLNLMLGLRAKGYEQACVVRYDSEFAERLQQEGITILTWQKALPIFGSGYRPILAFDKDFQADIVHAHTGNAHTLAFNGFAGKKPVVVTRRVDFPVKQNARSQKKYQHNKLHFVAISNAIAMILKAGGVSENNISVIPSGIDPKRFVGNNDFPNEVHRQNWRSQWKASKQTFVFGMVGSYVDHKDPLNLVRAAGHLREEWKDFRVILIGDGDLRPELEREISELGLTENVILTGWQNNVGPLLSGLDAFVMPSKMEGLCTSLLDAQAVGLPCVACAAGGIPDIIEDGYNGLLAPPQSPSALADSMLRLSQSQEMCHQFVEAGKRKVEENFTTERMVDRYVDLYDKILFDFKS